MEFKKTLNTVTGNETYFVNNKRVSKDKFSFLELSCKFSNKKYNSSYIETNKKYQYFCSSYS